MDTRLFLGSFLLTNILCLATAQIVPIDCEKCLKDPSYCRRVSGLFTVTVMTKGTYNPVVEIPAPACSINITELRSSSNYIGVKTSSNTGIINSYWALGQPGQYYGAGTRFSYDRQSGSCKGSCIFAEGPITENIIVQILYNDINPGIAYEFTLPRNVEFKPYNSASGSIRKDSSTSTSSSSSRTTNRRVRPNRPQRPSTASRNSGREEFKGEYYSGSQSIRSEGRPEETAEATGPASSSRRVIANERAAQTLRRGPISYGSHTLGGRGLSYTAYNSARRRGQGQGSNSSPISSTRSSSRSGRRRHLIRKISSPTYSSQSSSSSSKSNSRRNYSRQAQYQSFSAKTSYLNGVKTGGNRYLRTYDRRNSASSRGSARYRWKISGLTECSRSCGGGVQKTNIVCISIGTRTQVVVTPENCENLYRPRVQTVECNTSPCDPAWESDDWSACSVTCGYGTQTRKIECRRRFSSTLTLRVSADQCGLENKPAVAKQCEESLCSNWHTGIWSQCSKECGGGERQRDVRCVDSLNSPIPSNFCIEARPREREVCNTQQCQADWWLSDWSSECTESCGTGYQFRKALCLNENGAITQESSCDTKHLPELRQFCESDTSCVGTWITSSWGKCSAQCGRGRRKRTVVCMRLTSTTIQPTNEGECNTNLKPSSEEACVESDCPSTWYTSTWSQCSVTCGRGFKTRDVKCLDESNRPSVSCASSLKPETREACTLDSCNLYQRTDGHEEDGEEDETLHSELFEGSEESPYEKIEGALEEEEEEGETSDRFEPYETVDANNGESEDEEAVLTSKQSSSSINLQSRPEEDDCTDTYYNCLMVIQSRMCIYQYYRDRCCQSCRKSYGP